MVQRFHSWCPSAVPDLRWQFQCTQAREVRGVWPRQAKGTGGLRFPQPSGLEDDVACEPSSLREIDEASAQECAPGGRGNDPNVGSRRVGADEDKCCDCSCVDGEKSGSGGGLLKLHINSSSADWGSAQTKKPSAATANGARRELRQSRGWNPLKRNDRAGVHSSHSTPLPGPLTEVLLPPQVLHSSSASHRPRTSETGFGAEHECTKKLRSRR